MPKSLRLCTALFAWDGPPMRCLVYALAMLMFLAPLAIGQEPSHEVLVTLDPARTNIRWTLSDVLHTVHGTFTLKSGMIRFSPNSGDASGAIIIDSASGDSGSKARDQRMHKEVLESTRYPTIAFRPLHVYGKGDLTSGQAVAVDGIFSIHGQDHPLQIPVTFQRQGSAISLTAHFDVPYVRWGMKDPSTFILRVGKEVSIDVKAAGTARP